MNNAGKSNDERIVAYALQNEQTPILTIAGMKLAFTVKLPANPESEVWLLWNSEIEIIFQYSRAIFTSISYFLFRSERKKNSLITIEVGSSTVKAISDFLVTQYISSIQDTRFQLIKDWTLILIIQGLNKEKNHTYRLLAHYQGTKGKRIRKTRANSLSLISLWSYLKEEIVRDIHRQPCGLRMWS